MSDPVVHSNVIGALGGFPDNWDKITGGDMKGNYAQYIPAGAKEPQQIPTGTATYDDIVLTRGYVVERDSTIVAWARLAILTGINNTRTITKTYRNPQGIPLQTEAWLVKPDSFKTPDGESGSNNVGEIAMTFKVVRKLS